MHELILEALHHDREERCPITSELALVAHRVAGCWLFSWELRGRLMLGEDFDPYRFGSDEPN